MIPMIFRFTTFIVFLASLINWLPHALSKHHPKCFGLIVSDAYDNHWQTSKAKWKSVRGQTEGIVETTIRGRVSIPTLIGDGYTSSDLCYAQLKVNLSDCSIVFAGNANTSTGWTPHSSPIYHTPEAWLFNDTLSFRPSCPENIHVEVNPNRW